MKFLYTILLSLHTVLSIPFVPILPLHQTYALQHYNTDAYVYANISRIVVIADIHDDMRRFKNILQHAKIINKDNEWIANKNTVVVQLGDQIDKKHIDDDDITNAHHFRMTYFTDFLKQQALENDCDFISMIGNHEHMNLNKIRAKEALKSIIAKRPIVAIINNYLFCHGGFTLEHYNVLKVYHKNIKDLNDIWYKYVSNIQLDYQEEMILQSLIADKNNSVLYIRNLGDKYDNNILFKKLDLEYMFVGHSETKNIFVRNKIWHLDQILRLAFDDRAYNYIDIQDDNITIIPILEYTN